MRRVANDPDRFRFRSDRQGGTRGLGRALAGRAPRTLTSGQDAAESSGGGAGIGILFGVGPGIIPGDTDIGIPEIGDPETGQRTAVWGHFVWDSTLDVFGA